MKDTKTYQQSLNAQNLELLRKGIYPYEYMDSFERFNETQLPLIDKFYSNLSDENITQKDYEHAHKRYGKNSTVKH